MNKSKEYHIVEKKNHSALRGIFDDFFMAEKHLRETIPEYVKKSYFTDKTLTPESFEIIEKRGV